MHGGRDLLIHRFSADGVVSSRETTPSPFTTPQRRVLSPDTTHLSQEGR
jgi:hypothetical protein